MRYLISSQRLALASVFAVSLFAFPANAANNGSTSSGAVSASGLSLLANGNQSGFPGQINAPITGSAVSISAVTGGLVGGPQTIDLLLRAAASTGNGNGNVNGGAPAVLVPGLGLRTGGAPLVPGSGLGAGGNDASANTPQLFGPVSQESIVRG